MPFCLLFLHTKPFLKGVYSKRIEFAPLGKEEMPKGEQILAFVSILLKVENPHYEVAL